MSAPITKKIYTQQEYLELERKATFKSEFYQGEIFAMAGSSLNHNRLVSRMITKVGSFLEGKSCEIFGSDLRIHIPENTLYTYPDAIIVCGEPQLLNKEFDTVLNPSVIIEILSASTRDYDRGGKFKLYRSIKTLSEYILISSEGVNVEIFSKNENGIWELSEFNSPEETFTIKKISYEMSLKDLYQGLEFSA